MEFIDFPKIARLTREMIVTEKSTARTRKYSLVKTVRCWLVAVPAGLPRRTITLGSPKVLVALQEV